MKKIIIIVVVGFAILATYWTAEGFLDAMLKDQRRKPREPSLVEISKHVNATTPKQIDKHTRLDTTVVGPGNRLTYKYTLLNYATNDLDLPTFVSTLKPDLIKLCKSPKYETFRRRQVELQFDYNDQNGNPIASVLVSPKDF